MCGDMCNDTVMHLRQPKLLHQAKSRLRISCSLKYATAISLLCPQASGLDLGACTRRDTARFPRPAGAWYASSEDSLKQLCEDTIQACIVKAIHSSKND